MRYTYKIGNNDYCGAIVPNEHHNSIKPCIIKLGQLEDVEEELGIDLITLFKAMKTEVPLYYIDEDNNIIEFKCFCDEYSYHYKEIDLKHEAIGVYTDVCHLEKHLYFKDYGKTWALTKEELE